MSEETVVLDPAELIDNRVELGLDELGLRVVSADWGDSEHELFLIRQKLGEEPADRHPPNRTVTLKLQARPEAEGNLAEVLDRLQKKVGRLKDEGGFARRDMDPDGGFATSTAFVVKGATLAGVQGWLMAHRQIAPEIELILTTGPYCYGTSEIESLSFEASEVHRLEWLIENIKGSAPGLIRIKVTNEGETNWLGVINSMESRYSSGDEDAKMSYEANDFEILGAAEEDERAGASEGKVVRTGPLAERWQPIIQKQLKHTGDRRVFVRLWDPNENSGNVRLRLEWRVLGSLRWQTVEERRTLIDGAYSVANLGWARIEEATLGEQHWEIRISARTVGTPGEEAELDIVYLASTEQFALVNLGIEESDSGSVKWEDTFAEAEEKAMTGQEAPIGGVYAGAGDADDFSGEPLNARIKRSANKDANWSETKGAIGKGRFLIAGSSKMAETQLKGRVSNLTNVPKGKQHGFLFRYVDESNWGLVCLTRSVTYVMSGTGIHELQFTKLQLYKCVAGVVQSLGQAFGDFSKDGGTILLTVNSEGQILAKLEGYSESVYNQISKTDSDFAIGGPLEEGKVGVYDAVTGSEEGSTTPRYYSLVSASEGEPEQDAICFSGRGMEFRSEGVFRQHQTKEYWARLVPVGSLPEAPPSGLEGRAMRGIVIPSVGNFENVADGEPCNLKIEVLYFPGYHFTSESE